MPEGGAQNLRKLTRPLSLSASTVAARSVPAVAGVPRFRSAITVCTATDEAGWTLAFRQGLLAILVTFG